MKTTVDFSDWLSDSETSKKKVQAEFQHSAPMRAGLILATRELREYKTQSDRIVNQFFNRDVLQGALQLSYLKKVSPDDYRLVKDIVLSSPKNISNWTAVALACEEFTGRFSDEHHRMTTSLNNLTSWQLSKLFRFPLLGNNKLALVSYVNVILEEKKSDLTSKGAFNLLVLSFALLDREDFLKITKVLEEMDLIADAYFEPALSAVLAATKKTDKPLISPKLNTLKPVRIALCYSGQLRGYEEAAKSIKHLQLDGEDVSTFVHTWRSIGRRQPDPDLPQTVERAFGKTHFSSAFIKASQQYGIGLIKAQYSELFKSILQNNSVNPIDLRDVYGENTPIIIDDETEPNFSDLKNQEKMHYKIWAANELQKNSSKDFDLVVRIRPDMRFLEPKTPVAWRDILDVAQKEKVLYTDEAPGLRENLIIGDQFAVSTPEVMAVYANAWSWMKTTTNPKWIAWGGLFEGHSTLAYNAFFHGIECRRMPGYRSGGLVDTNVFSTSQIKDVIEAQISGRDTHPADNEIITALQKDLGV